MTGFCMMGEVAALLELPGFVEGVIVETELANVLTAMFLGVGILFSFRSAQQLNHIGYVLLMVAMALFFWNGASVVWQMPH